MQNLFPAEGEKVPKLRFKEFENSGVWEEKTLENVYRGTPEYGIKCKQQFLFLKLPTLLRITIFLRIGNFLSNNKVSVDKEVTENNSLSKGI